MAEQLAIAARPGEPPQRLVREWIACALVAAGSRFVPLPLVDDVIKGQAIRLSIVRTVRAHGRDYPLATVQRLYGDTLGEMVAGFVTSLPIKIVTYPVRKIRKFVGAVKGVPTDIARVLLLNRAVHRRLVAGGLAHPDPQVLRHEAAVLREAFDDVTKEMDLRILVGALRDTLSGARVFTGQIGEYGKRLLSRDAAQPTPEPEGEVRESVDRVERVLASPEIRRLLTEFDSRMDARLAAHGYIDPSRALPPGPTPPPATEAAV